MRGQKSYTDQTLFPPRAFLQEVVLLIYPLFSSPLIRSEIVWDELDDNPFDRPYITPYGVEHILLEQIPGVSLVRNWKILIAPFTTRKAQLGDCIIRELLVFCRTASQNTISPLPYNLSATTASTPMKTKTCYLFTNYCRP